MSSAEREGFMRRAGRYIDWWALCFVAVLLIGYFVGRSS